MKCISKALCMVVYMFLANYAFAMNISGSVSANNPIVSGDVSASSITVSTLTITDHLIFNGKTVEMVGLTRQSVMSTITSSASTTSTTLTPIPGLNATLALSNANNYFRISLNGILTTSDYTSRGYASISRDSSDIGGGGYSVVSLVPDMASIGATITDSPGDISTHTYRATFRTNVSTATVTVIAPPAAYLLIEEISR